MPKLWKLLAVLLISMFGCNDGLAMQFSQPEEIGFVGTAKGGVSIRNATKNTGTYYTVYDKNNKHSYDKGVARFGNGNDALYVYYNAQQYDSSEMCAGGDDISNTVKVRMMSDSIYRIQSDTGLVFYGTNFAYGPDSQWKFIGRRKDGKFVVYIDTEEIAKRYFGEDTNGRCKEWVTFDKLSCSNDELILTYWIGGKQCIGKGEFRFKWDEAAQWFSVEQVAY